MNLNCEQNVSPQEKVLVLTNESLHQNKYVP
jgi:hypothetical protein